jgi:hypothetical protein
MTQRCSAAKPAGTLTLQPLALQFSGTDTHLFEAFKFLAFSAGEFHLA